MADAGSASREEGPEGAGDWKVFDLARVAQRARGARSPYLEFLRVPSLSCGLYTLPAGAKDLQGPHDEDEVYYVLEGRARLRIGDEETAVRPGMMLFVRATEEHSFFEIEEDMVLLVFFATGGPEPG